MRASFRLHDGPNIMAKATQVYGTRELSGSCTDTIKNIDRRRKYIERGFGLYELASETTHHPVGWWVVPDMRRLPLELNCRPRTVKERDQCVALVVFRNKKGSWNGVSAIPPFESAQAELDRELAKDPFCGAGCGMRHSMSAGPPLPRIGSGIGPGG